MPGPRRDIRTGNYLCGWGGCNQPAFQNLYVYCRTHFDHAVDEGHYVPRILSITSALQPQPQPEIPNRPDPLRPGFYLCLSRDCPYPTYDRFAYCVSHSTVMDNAGQTVPRLGQAPVEEPKIINQYQWFASGLNSQGRVLHYFEGDPHSIREILEYTGGVSTCKEIIRGLEMHEYHKIGTRIRGPQFIHQAMISGTRLAKTFKDSMKVPRRYHRELAEALASGVRIGTPNPGLPFENPDIRRGAPVFMADLIQEYTVQSSASTITSSSSAFTAEWRPLPVSPPATELAARPRRQTTREERARDYAADYTAMMNSYDHSRNFFGRPNDHSDEADWEE